MKPNTFSLFIFDQKIIIDAKGNIPDPEISSLEFEPVQTILNLWFDWSLMNKTQFGIDCINMNCNPPVTILYK